MAKLKNPINKFIIIMMCNTTPDAVTPRAALLGGTFIAGQIYEFTVFSARGWATPPAVRRRPSTR